MNIHITQGNVFDDLGFDKTKAANLKIRATLMRAIECEQSNKKLIKGS